MNSSIRKAGAAGGPSALLLASLLAVWGCGAVSGQESAFPDTGATGPADAASGDASSEKSGTGGASDKGDLKERVSDKVSDVAKQVNQDPRAEEARAGILKPIYQLAERLESRPFHWVAFALMVTGVVNFGLQLVLGKLIMLAKLKISLVEILSDGSACAACLIGLVLTTQAATQNSQFTANAFSVISATAVGVLFGLVFYWRGQSQELLAAKAERSQRK